MKRYYIYLGTAKDGEKFGCWLHKDGEGELISCW